MSSWPSRPFSGTNARLALHHDVAVVRRRDEGVVIAERREVVGRLAVGRGAVPDLTAVVASVAPDAAADLARDSVKPASGQLCGVRPERGDIDGSVAVGARAVAELGPLAGAGQAAANASS